MTRIASWPARSRRRACARWSTDVMMPDRAREVALARRVLEAA